MQNPLISENIDAMLSAEDLASKHPLKYRYIQKVRAVTPIGYSPNGMI